MKYYPRLNLYKAANLTFNPDTGNGTSYNWYLITKFFGNTLVLNSYRYSVTTAKHVCKLRSLFIELGLKFIEIEAPRGLQDLESSVRLYTSEIETLEEEIANKRSRPEKNEERKRSIVELRKLLKTVGKLQQVK